jgi:hypothetical protein
VAVLALSRPFEGFVVVLIALSFTLVGRTRLARAGLRRLAVAVAIVATVGGGFHLHFNRVVTGDSWTMPYSHLTAMQDAAPLFIFQGLPERPEYVDEHVDRFFTEWAMEWYTLQQGGLGSLIAAAVARPVVAGVGYLFGPVRNGSGPPFWFPSVLILPLLLPLHLVRRWEARRVILSLAVLFGSLNFVTYFLPHYVAVLTSMWMLLVLLTLRILRVMVRRTSFRSCLVPGVVLLSWALLVPPVVRQRHLNRDPSWFANQKVALSSELAAHGGEHLVLVSYGEDYDLHIEWVYNSAELDEQTVIWARSLDPEEDAALLRFYGERSGWRLDLRAGVLPALRPIHAEIPTP